MPISQSKAASNKRHLAKLDNIMVRPALPEGEQIRAAAAAAGQSLQGYILDAVRERMQREETQGNLQE